MSIEQNATRQRRHKNHAVDWDPDTEPAEETRRGFRDEHKQFIPRESPLTNLLNESAHIRAIYNIFVAILVMLFLNTVIFDFVESGKINVGWATVVAGFGDPLRAARLWLFELAAALTVYPGMRLFAVGYRLLTPYTVLRRVWCAICLVGLLGLQGTLVAVPVKNLGAEHLAMASAITVVCELFRFVMKIHAFAWAVAPRVIRSDGASTELPRLRHYVYFLFVPTLIYRDQYPRTKSVRWGVVATHMAEVAAIVFYNSFLWERFILPYWSDFGKKETIAAGQLVRAMFACVIPGLTSYLCGFYCMLHAWFNAFAEALRFADRLFYEDWWTTSRFSTFYRSWNRVVHAWLAEHVLAPLAPRVGRTSAVIAVFVLSAVAHELVLTLSYGFFYPVLTVMMMTTAVLCVPFTSALGRRYPRAFNFMIWLALFIGNGLLWSLYPMEYFARLNCPRLPTDSYLVPKSWSCPRVVLKPDWQFHNPFNFTT